MGKGLTAIMDGFDGCLLPFALLLFGGIVAPIVGCVAVVFYSRAGIEGAATPEFVRTVVIGLGVLVALGLITVPLSTWGAARSIAARPHVMMPAPSPINVKLTGTVAGAEPMVEEPSALPFDDFPLLVDNRQS